MRHGKSINHLGRTASHRKAMLSNMATSLILHKRITTTVAKAKELRKLIEPLITKSKDDSTHSRRTVFSYLQNKESVKILFNEIAEKSATRPGGYTRIIKLGTRQGDAADICIIELVDYNETMLASAAPAEKKTRRGRSKATGSNAANLADQTIESTPVDMVTEDKVEVAGVAQANDDVTTPTPDTDAPATDAAATEEEEKKD